MTVQGGNFQGVAGNIGPRGWSYAGSTKDGLTRLGEEHGFSWSVQDGEVTAIGDRFMLGSYVELNGENGGPDQHRADADRADADPVRGEDQGPLRSRHQRWALHQGQQHAQSPLERPRIASTP